ncbi:hypothetical protein LXL04_016136 [Taraxacum kok-saghyz]
MFKEFESETIRPRRFLIPAHPNPTTQGLKKMSGGEESSSLPVGRFGFNPNEPFKEVPKENRTAPIWDNFVQLKQQNKYYGRCYLCKKVYAGSNATLGRHDISCRKKHEDAVAQTQVDNDGQSWHYDNDLAHQLSMKLIIEESLPFDFFSRPRVIAYIKKALQPNFCQVSRRSLKRDAMKKFIKIHEDPKKFFTHFLGRVSLTTDVWTAPHGTCLSFICITVHWIDPKTWFMQKRILAFEQFAHPHAGENYMKF